MPRKKTVKVTPGNLTNFLSTSSSPEADEVFQERMEDLLEQGSLSKTFSFSNI